MSTRTTRHILLAAAMAVGLLLQIAPAVDAADGSPDDLLIIANKAFPESKVSMADLRAVFLKKKTALGGSRVVPINIADSSTARQVFRKKVLGMTGAEEESYWEDQKIKSGITAPTSFANPVKAVFTVKGGISYCYRRDFKEGAAKILAVL